MANEQNGVLRTQTVSDKQVVDFSHPPLIDGIEFKADQGTLAKGQFVSLDADGKGIPYTEADNNFKGVLNEKLDTTVNTIGATLVHGCYVLANCLVAGAVPTAEAVAIAKAKLVFPV